MNIPFPFWIIITGMICGSIGFFAAVFLLAVKRERIERDAWNQASVFYTRKQTERGL